MIIIGDGSSDILTIAGIVIAVLVYVFSVSSNVNKSILIETKAKKNKLLGVMIIIFIAFGYIIANYFWLFLYPVLVVKAFLVVGGILFLLKDKSFKIKTTKRIKILHVELLILVAAPLIEGIFVYSIIDYIIAEMTFDKLLLLLVDIISAVLVIGILYFRSSEKQELYEIILVKDISLDNEIVEKEKNELIYGQLISESDSFYDIQVLSIKDKKITKQEQLCINKSNISHFKSLVDSTLEWEVEVTKKKRKKKENNLMSNSFANGLIVQFLIGNKPIEYDEDYASYVDSKLDKNSSATLDLESPKDRMIVKMLLSSDSIKLQGKEYTIKERTFMIDGTALYIKVERKK